ncbi:MAG: type II toxin-antitoxin system Phd/YefM family antitoxin [Verrucomicrobia bacterium]|nr:type II toxin-antitoxin system Phd/YefM family antitoxin [Verrucomicrobiota bacterium]MDA1085478.1 type II toxin-antitoxin system Phd/YefM family antitoxin [Verrucomicrobiota bacterium]
MKLSQIVIPVSEAKNNTAKMIDDVVKKRRPAVITQNGRARVIVQDLRSYEEMQESLAMLKIAALGRIDVRDGKIKPLRKAFADVRKQIRERQSE